ncbi:MAG: hypothetical protein ABI430_02940 [Candidatus Taylorbacteria bacterium]
MENKKIIIDLKGIKNENDIQYRFYKSIDCFYSYSESEFIEKVKNDNLNASWAAFEDNISGLDIKENGERIKELTFIVTNILDLKQKLSQEALINLLLILSRLTDPAQRIDGINFFFQIRLKDYEPEKEELHSRLHRGLPGGKDMNN